MSLKKFPLCNIKLLGLTKSTKHLQDVSLSSGTCKALLKLGVSMLHIKYCTCEAWNNVDCTQRKCQFGVLRYGQILRQHSVCMLNCPDMSFSTKVKLFVNHPSTAQFKGQGTWGIGAFAVVPQAFTSLYFCWLFLSTHEEI